MKTIFFLLVISTILACKIKKQEFTAFKNKREKLNDLVDKASLLKEPYNTWFSKNYEAYTPDSTVISTLKQRLKGITIKGFMGTWCRDSEREIPHLYSVLEAADFNFKNLQLHTVNRNKKNTDNLQKRYHIKRIPTFIFFKNKKEIGRYIESARKTLEADILTITAKNTYKYPLQN